MDFLKKNAGVIAVIALIIAVIGVYTPRIVQKVGGVTNYDTLGLSGLKVGSGCNDGFGSCNGSTISRVNMGTCYVLAYSATIAASSTASVDCQATALIYLTNTTNAAALTGVTAGDKTFAQFATSTAGTVSNGLVIIGASASTTSGYITLRVSNLTGGTYTWPTTGVATGTVNYLILK